MYKDIYIALLHYPVYNKRGATVTAAVTNLDIHDISRAAKTYGVRGFYIVTPLKQQRSFVERILHHWQKGYGAIYNPFRTQAFDIIRLESTLDDTIKSLSRETGRKVNVVITSATSRGKLMTCIELKEKISESGETFLIIFGTGWGVTEEVIAKADFFVEPIRGDSDYNHLSVRSAVAITLDRLYRQ
ncbi:MAG: RNA methyltransferase [Thermodesulfobacteriota bacterium]|nr:RNA methyltransferase [Thermodesulfobacteriota bacterium]